MDYVYNQFFTVSLVTAELSFSVLMAQQESKIYLIFFIKKEP